MRLSKTHMGLALLCAFLAAAVLMQACGTTEETATQPPAATSEVAQPTAEPAESEKSKVDLAIEEGALNLYWTSPLEEGTAYLDAFAAKYPGINVSGGYRAAAAPFLERYMSEANAGIYEADVFLVGSALIETLRDNLRPYTSPNSGTEDQDPNGLWTANRYYGLAIMVNSELLPEDQWPTDWRDFINPRPEWQGKVCVLDPYGTTSGFQTFYSFYENYGMDDLRAILEGLKSVEAAPFASNTPMIEALQTGEYAIAFNVLYDRYLAAQAEGAPIEMIYPESGIVLYTHVLALTKESKHPNAAELFVDFMLSEEGQQLVADLGYWPARPGISPELLTPLNDTAVLRHDETVAESQEAKDIILPVWQEIMGE